MRGASTNWRESLWRPLTLNPGLDYGDTKKAIVTVSGGSFGGIYALAQLRLVMFGLGAFAIPASFPVSKVQETFTEDGTPKDSSYEKRAEVFIAEVLWFAEAIKNQKALKIST